MTTGRFDSERSALLAARARYDALGPGDRAILRRCKTEQDLRLEGAFWRVAGELRDRPGVATAVLLFPLAPHRAIPSFSLGRFLSRNLSQNKESAGLRFRRLIQADREGLAHQLRSVLRLASGGDRPVDWSILGLDLLLFGDVVRRNWSQDFFAPLPSTTTASSNA